MKQCLDWPVFVRGGLVAALVATGALSGCATATIDEAVPTAAGPQAAPASAQGVPATDTVPSAVATAEAASSVGPKDTGTYPNLNVPRQSANAQFTPEQRAAEAEALQAAHTAQAAQATSTTTDPAILRKLAETHADEALKKIEGEPPQ